MFNEVTKSVRVLCASAVEKAKSGHPGMPLGMAEVGTVLFKDYLNVTPDKPDWINRDRFVLSAGHGSMLLYSLLHFNGFNLSINDIKKFRQLNSTTPGHPEYSNKEGIDTTTGPLGQGFANGVGMALAERYLSEKFGEDVINHYVYGIVSDGDLMEGVSTEAAELAGTWGLGKIIYFFDNNNISIDGSVDKVSITNQKLKFESMGWHVLEIDAHNYEEIISSIADAQSNLSRPSLIVATSEIGKYAPTKANTSSSHGEPLGEKEMEGFLENLGWVGDVFDHPKEVYEYFSDKRIQSSDDFNKWSENLETRLSDNTFKGLWSDFISSGISFEDLELTEAKASRASGAEVLSEIAKSNEFILGGSGDLAASTKQLVGDTYFTKDNPLGRNIEYGVREHAMAGITNGIVLHSNLKAFASTFLVFSDYMRPSIRLSALMGIDSVFIFTHDSLLLGEDGPTHQPVEHLMSLRLIPNLDVVRPSNGNEINYAYRYAFSSNNGPTSIILSRQGLDPVNSSLTQEEFDQGAYIVKEGSDASIFASGSEVSTALKIVDELKEYSIQVVSVPILNKLIDIDNEILEKLRGKEKVFTLEIGTSVGWADYIGKVDESFSLNSFGSSAPKDDLENFFKLDIKTVSERIKKKLN
tara:strand:+ start:8120 stop:10039 length:1920 start_codon:yes stop_codon:yes gene_type:complete